MTTISAESIRSSEVSGLRRFSTIVLATFGGSIACCIWVFMILAFATRLPSAAEDSTSGAYGWSSSGSLVENVFLAVVNPYVWFLGLWFGVLLGFPALGCLWPRRLFPALSFVLAIGFGVATGLVIGSLQGANWAALAPAPLATGVAVIVALLIVRCVPLSIWTLEHSRGV